MNQHDRSNERTPEQAQTHEHSNDNEIRAGAGTPAQLIQLPERYDLTKIRTKRDQLTHQKAQELNWDPITQVLSFKNQPGLPGIGPNPIPLHKAGTKNKHGEQPLAVSLGGIQILLHRLIFAINNPDPLPETIDHKNTIPSDNNPTNLRPADRCQNQWNRGKPINNTSGFKGISFNKTTRHWQCRIMARGKLHYRHFRHDQLKEARKWMICARGFYHGKYARHH